MTPPVVVLYVSDDGDRDDRAASLRCDGLAVEATDSATAAERAAAVDCVVCEADLDGPPGVSLVADLRERHPDLPLVLFPANGDERLASEAVSAGVSEYVRRTGEDAYDRLAAGVRRVTGERDDRSDLNGTPAPRGGDGNGRDRRPAAADGTRHVDREAILSDLHAATRDLMAAESPAAIGEIVVETANEVLDLPITSMLLYEGASGRLEPVASTDEAVSLFGSIPSFGPEGESVAWRTFETGDPTLYEDVRKADDVYDPDTPIRTELQIPLGDHGVLITGTTEQRTFEDYFVDFAQLLAANAEVALERARRVELLQRRERELSESEDRFRTIAEHIDSEVWMTDPEKTELYYVSPRHEDIWGQDLSVGDSPREILDYVHEDDREDIREAMQEQADGGYVREYRIEHPEKGTRWVHDRAFPIREDGEVTRIVGITDDVTERKRRERELERYQRIFETVRDRVYVLDEDGRFILVNDPLLSMLGYDRSELLGSHVSAVVADDAVERALLDDGTGAVTVEAEIATADGGRIPCEIESATLTESDAEFRGSVGVVRDISDRKQVKAELERQRDRLSALFENIPDPVARTEAVDGEPVVREVNRAFERVFGYEADEIVGESLNDFVVPPDGVENAAELDEKTIGGERVQEEVRRQTDSGIRHFLFRGVPVEVGDSAGTVESYDIYTDITDQKTRERRLQVLNRVLRHNMRNDMNVISGHAETLDRDADGEYVETAATAIEETANEVARLSDKIRDVEQTLDRGADVRRRVDLADVVDGLVDPLRESDAVGLTVDVPPDLGVKADQRLATALEHLIDNAVDHSDRATPSVRIAAERVGDGWVDVEIRDDGPGIPLAERDVLTGDREITQLEHGSGLGLWLVNWIVTALGGDVRFDDNDPRGSVVTVRLQAA